MATQQLRALLTRGGGVGGTGARRGGVRTPLSQAPLMPPQSLSPAPVPPRSTRVAAGRRGTPSARAVPRTRRRCRPPRRARCTRGAAHASQMRGAMPPRLHEGATALQKRRRHRGGGAFRWGRAGKWGLGGGGTPPPQPPPLSCTWTAAEVAQPRTPRPPPPPSEKWKRGRA